LVVPDFSCARSSRATTSLAASSTSRLPPQI
jgi:hypothetical protein